MSVADVSLTCFYIAFGGYLLSFLSGILRKERLAEVFFVAGFISHTLSQITRGWYIGFFFPNPMFNEVSFLPWCLAALGLGLRFFKKEDKWLQYLIGPVFVFAFIAFLYPKGILPPFPKNQIFFSPLFFGVEVVAHACFIIGALFAFLYLRQKLETKLFHDLVIWGFVFYSISQVVGALWAYLGWGSPFNWSDRHLGSAAIWCYYAAYLHLSFVAKWDLHRRAGIAFLGLFLVLVFSFNYQFSELGQMIR